MLSTSTNTFLTIDSSLQLGKITVWIHSAKEDWFELQKENESKIFK